MDTLIKIIIVLDLLLIGVVFLVRWANTRSANEIEAKIDDSERRRRRHRMKTNDSLVALGSDFTNYQLQTDRKLAELKKEIETKTNQLERVNYQIKGNIQKIKENIPNKPVLEQTLDNLKRAITKVELIALSSTISPNTK